MKTVRPLRKKMPASESELWRFWCCEHDGACSNQVWFIAKITNWLHRSGCPKYETISMEKSRNNHRMISPRPLSLHFAYCEKYEYFTSWDKDSWQVAHKSSLVFVSLPKLHECNVAIAFPRLLCWFTQQKCMAHYFSFLLLFSDIFTDRREHLWPFKWQEHIMNNLGPSPADWPLAVLQLSGTKKCILSHCWIYFFSSEGGSPELRHNLLVFPLVSPILSGILSFWSNLQLGRWFE